VGVIMSRLELESGSGTKSIGVKGPGVDVGDSSNCDGGNDGHERQLPIYDKVERRDDDGDLRSVNASSRPCASVLPCPPRLCSLLSSSSSSCSTALAGYLLITTTPSLSSSPAPPPAYVIRFNIVSFLATLRRLRLEFVHCTYMRTQPLERLRPGHRKRCYCGMRRGDRNRNRGRGVCALLRLGLMRTTRRNRMKKRLLAWSQME
jgi:hypothetical protein